jgi:hypothetical protein
MRHRHIVTREPTISLMFVTSTGEDDDLGVAILIHNYTDLHREFCNSTNSTSLPHPKYWEAFTQRCTREGRSNADVNESTVVAAILIQVLSKEYQLSLSDWSFPSPYDPSITSSNWAAVMAA